MSDNIFLSILLPSRERPHLLRRLLDNLHETAESPDNLEVVLYLDSDDTASHAVEHGRLKLVKLIGPRMKMGVMSRACHRAATGRYFMLMNDDVLCRTGGWDAALVKAFERFSDEIALVSGVDADHDQPMPNFPAVSRRACELMGGICPADYSRDYIDTHLFDIFTKLKSLGHDRMACLCDVVFEHQRHENGGSSCARFRESCDELAFIAWEEQRAIAARRLARHIDGLAHPAHEPPAAAKESWPCASS